MPRYLSKSRFKEGLDCITKLYYTGKKNEYANQSLDDPFLKALAEGGFQVGELAKYMFCDDPVGDDITVETLNTDEALLITAEKFGVPGKVVLAEAAFKYENLIIRADVIVKEGNRIDLYEVKAKSFDGDEVDNTDSFLSYKGKPTESIGSKWAPYLYDLAFQKYVITKAFPYSIVRAHLVLADKSAKASIDGLNQLFQIEKNEGRTRVKIKEGLTKADLGEPVLTVINLDDLVEKIWHDYKMPTTYGNELSFEDYVMLCSDTYENDTRIFAPISAACRDCTYQVKPGKDDDKKSGLKECWKNHTGYSDELLAKPLAFSLWQGRTNNQIQDGIFLLENIPEESIISKSTKKATDEKAGLTREERRLMQIRKTKAKNTGYYFDKAGFDAEVEGWVWPLHMIDFETSTVALPFYKDTTPYQGSAFQFSHHVMHKDGRVEHRNEFIHFVKGEYPNLHFIKALKESLLKEEGTIFRYHNHENSYLRMIYRELENGLGNLPEAEKNELLQFIDNITRHKPDGKNYTFGKRNMVDLYDLVVRYYYPPSANGKAGLKFILPAIIKDSDYLRNKYGRKGIYGKGLEIKSLNFDDHQWIDPENNNDPYKTLPKIFDEWAMEELDCVIGDFDDVADGGAALTAYNYLQFTNIPDDQRAALKDALLRYCELDTMAMVMLVEGLMRLENNTAF